MGGRAQAQIHAQMLLRRRAGADVATAVSAPRMIVGDLEIGGRDVAVEEDFAAAREAFARAGVEPAVMPRRSEPRRPRARDRAGRGRQVRGGVRPAQRRGGGLLVSAAPAAADPLLDVSGLHVELLIEGVLRPVIHDVSLQIRAGEAVGLVGESGSGKSMTARAIARLLPGRRDRRRRDRLRRPPCARAWARAICAATAPTGSR